MREKTKIWWQALSDRERRILLIWASVVGALLLWFAIVAPLQNRNRQLEARIPELESRLNAMRAQPTDTHLAQVMGNKNGTDLRSNLFRLLSDKKISAELRAISSSRVEMRLPELPMQDALDLLDALRQESSARVVVFNAKTESANSKASRVVVELESRP